MRGKGKGRGKGQSNRNSRGILKDGQETEAGILITNPEPQGEIIDIRENMQGTKDRSRGNKGKRDGEMGVGVDTSLDNSETYNISDMFQPTPSTSSSEYGESRPSREDVRDDLDLIRTCLLYTSDAADE